MRGIFHFGVILLIFLVILWEFEGVYARGRGGGGRGGSRGGYSRSSRSRSPSRSRSSPRTPTIYKSTKMPVTTYKSPVIKTQTRTASRSSKYPKYIAAGVVTYYALSHAPVYRGYYPMYGMHLRVPPERGIRVIEERQEIVNIYTDVPCYNATTKQATSSTQARDSGYSEDAENNELEKPANTTTIIVYEDGTEQKFSGMNDTELDAGKLDKQFQATTITDYNRNITGTKIQGNCTRVVTRTTARMIRVYDDNPFANSALVMPVTSFILISLLAFITYRLM